MKVLAATYEEQEWLVRRIGFTPTAWSRALKAVDDAGNIRGMVAYDRWTENSCEAHMAVDTPIAWRALLFPAFDCPFNHYGRGLILGIIASNNSRSLALAKRFGFRETYRVRDGVKPGTDIVIHEMRREECRWLKQEREAA